jgi:uncharacterized protein
MLSRIALVVAFAFGFILSAGAEEPKPLKVLWCTGGGFHDYKGLTPLLTKKIQQYANCTFVVQNDYRQWAKPGFADGCDAVVFFFSQHVKDPKDGQPIVDNIAATVKSGKPAMFIHGTLHSFRELKQDRDAFCEAIGLTSVAHDKSREIATKKAADHPISRFWPDDWKTPKDELYQNVKFWPNAKALMTAHSPQSNKDHVVTWVNEYGKARVFGTSLGHGTPTTDMESFHRLLANGLLWMCDKLDDNGQPKPGYAGSGKAAK